MTERDVPFLQGGNYTAAEVRRIVTALTGARDFVDLAPSTSPLVSAGGGHGVVGSTDMVVTAGAGTTVNVAAGVALVRGTQQSDQGVYVTSNDAAKNLTISAADATNPRKDLIVTRVKDAEYGIAGDTGPLEVVTGTPTGGLTAGNATGRPTPPENSLILAEVFVPAGAASSASYTITDLRTFANALGGIHRCLSTTRPDPAWEGLVIHEMNTDLRLFYNGAAWRYVPGQLLASAEVTSGQGGLGAGPTQLTSLSATFDALGGAVRVKCHYRATNSATASGQECSAREGGTIRAHLARVWAASSEAVILDGAVKLTPAAGSHTYDLFHSSGSNPGLTASAVDVAQIEVISA